MIIKTKQPDARIVGGLFAYILPEHVWGKVPVKQLTGSYKPPMPIVGSGPYVVSAVRPRAHHPHDAQPVLPRRRSRSSTRSSGSSTAPTTRSSGRSRSGRSTSSPRSRTAAFARLGQGQERQGGQLGVALVHAARVQPLQQAELPGREVQPGRPGPHGAPGDRLRDRPQAHQPDRLARHRVRGPRAAARVLQGLLLRAGRGLPARRRQGQPDARRGRLEEGRGRRAARRAARSCRSTCSCARSRRTTSRPRGSCAR